jgi:lipoprotein-anchoring transpeptidase ErfK/SrfK
MRFCATTASSSASAIFSGPISSLCGGEYAIHGTNVPGSIGGFVSYGCIRMFNADVLDLFGRVRLGTPVVVLR